MSAGLFAFFICELHNSSNQPSSAAPTDNNRKTPTIVRIYILWSAQVYCSGDTFRFAVHLEVEI